MSVVCKNTSVERLRTSKLLCGGHFVHVTQALRNLYKMRAALEAIFWCSARFSS